jgi:predicted dehydrogenase
MDSGSPMKIAFVGAGAINFGSEHEKTPWDHATRLEGLAHTAVNAGKYPLRFVGVADPIPGKAQAVIDARRAGEVGSLWSACKAFTDIDAMLSATSPDAVWVGVPPFAHGSLEGGKDIELRVLRHGAACFVEKPLSCLPVDEVATYARHVAAESQRRNLPVSVGYMFRYSEPVRLIKSLLERHAPGKVACFNARYNAAYTAIPAAFWWNTSRSGGPLVEQATHFIDLARYLVGDVQHDSITGIGIGANAGPLGKLTNMPESVREETIPDADRVPRASVTTWRFANGGVGVLNHALLLHGTAYENAITIWADGLSIEWERPYSKSTVVRVRVGNSDEYTSYTFEKDDMYATEDDAFLATVVEARDRNQKEPVDTLPTVPQTPLSDGQQRFDELADKSTEERILSTFHDGLRTYALSCALRDAVRV